MEGILLIDKPRGPSSFAVVAKARKLSGVKRIGHAGTLDPLASGLLVLCVGRSYTKLAGSLTDCDKTYETVIRLGISTTTDDSEGEILKECSTAGLTKNQILQSLEQFRGRISQVPPQFSAIKIGGRRAYDMARKNTNFVIPAREITIFELVVINISILEIRLRIHCSKGTYIRSLARDLGAALGVGGFAQEIRRIASGKLLVSDAIKLEDLNQETLANCLLGAGQTH